MGDVWREGGAGKGGEMMGKGRQGQVMRGGRLEKGEKRREEWSSKGKG